MQDTHTPDEGEGVCKLCRGALSPAETQDREENSEIFT